MSRVRLAARATSDLIEIGTYVAADNPAAALRLIDDLREKAELLAHFPELGRRDDSRPGRRLYVVGSYVIIYREEPGGVFILRVVHGRRDRGRL